MTYLTTTTLLQSSARAFLVPSPSSLSQRLATTTRLHMSTATNKPWAIVVHAEIDPARLEEFLPLITHNAEQSRQEPGCHRFDVLRDPAEPHKFIFYELYASTEAIEYHKQQSHYQAWADFKASGGALSSVTYKQIGESVVV